MKSTSIPYLLPLLLVAGAPLACSGSTDKITSPPHATGDAGAAGNDSHTTTGGAEAKDPGTPTDAGRANGGRGGTGNETSGNVGGDDAGGRDDGTSDLGGASAGGADSGGANAGGAGGSDDGTVEDPIDPSIDGATDAVSGKYRLHYASSQSCLAASEDEVSSALCAEQAAQGFFLDGAGDDFVRVRSTVTGACVNVEHGAVGPVVCGPSSKLQLAPLDDGYFQLILPSKKCIGLMNGEPSALTCSADTRWSLEHLGTNFALKATFGATSTFPGYSVDYIHDGDSNAGLSGHSWANDWNPPTLTYPQYVTVDFGAPRQFSQILLYTSADHEIGSYDIEYWTGNDWATLTVVTGNVQQAITHAFPTQVTSKLRIVVRRGPELQMNFARINELQVF